MLLGSSLCWFPSLLHQLNLNANVKLSLANSTPAAVYPNKLDPNFSYDGTGASILLSSTPSIFESTELQ
jgi:hypothetical protein